MSYGLSPYGLSPYGLGGGGDAAAERVLCVATTVVRVYLTVEPQHTNYAVLGDALNPLSWTITSPRGVVQPVIGVNQIDDTTYELVVLRPLTGTPDVYTLTWNLLDPSGAPLLPGSTLFYGMTATLSAANPLVPADLRNPQTSPGENGTLLVDSSGDYANENGASLLRKLALRRLTSTPGDYFFMPKYGVGLRLKEPAPQSELPALRTLIEGQMRQEPELARCIVRLRQDANRGIMFVTLITRDANGREVSTTLEIPQNPL